MLSLKGGEEMGSYELDVKNLKVEVEKKRMKKKYIRVMAPDGRVKVTAPYGVSDQHISEFVLKYRDRIEANIKQIHDIYGDCRIEYETGEEHNLWGIPHTLVVRQAEKDRVFLQGRCIVMEIRNPELKEARKKALTEFYRREIKRVIPHELERWEKKMGLEASEWRVRNMKTRWGSCNREDGRLWFNLKLAEYSPECLNYVIVHELAHLRVREHNLEFYSLVGSFIPEYIEIEKKLNSDPSAPETD